MASDPRFAIEFSKGCLSTGKCAWFNSEKGFGFLAMDDGSDDVFVHKSQLKCRGVRSLAEGESLEFVVVVAADGRRSATNVTGPKGTFCKGTAARSGYGHSEGYQRSPKQVVKAKTTGEPAPSQLPITKVSGVCHILIRFCDHKTRAQLADSCPQMNASVAAVWALDSRLPLKPFGIAVRSTVPVIHCKHSSDEIRDVLKAASGDQFIVCVLQRCALFFAKLGNYWVAAVHCDERDPVVVGWQRNACAHFSYRPIASPMTVPPSASVSLQWQTAVTGNGQYVAKSGSNVVFATFDGVFFLNETTGAIVSHCVEGRSVDFVVAVDNDRVIANVQYEDEDAYHLCEFTHTTLTKKDFLGAGIRPNDIKASADGKRLYVQRTKDCRHFWEEYCTTTAQKTGLQFHGRPNTGISAANGVVAVSGENNEFRMDHKRFIEIIECNSGCVTQTIDTLLPVDIHQLAFSPNSRRIAAVTKGRVLLYDAISGHLIGRPRKLSKGYGYCCNICWLTDDWFVTSHCNSLYLWHCDSWSYVFCFDGTETDDFELKREALDSALMRLSNDSFVTLTCDGDGHDTFVVNKWKLDFESSS